MQTQHTPVFIAGLAIVFLALSFFSFVRVAQLPARRAPLDPAWKAAAEAFGRDPVWRDGKAEVAHYAATRTVYGKPRPHEAVMITVAEDIDTATYTKADPPYLTKTLVPALKLNVIATIPTDNYPYHYMTSVFVPRADPTRLLKLAQSSQEWCGTTFKEVTGFAARPALRYHSYWGGQGDGEHDLPLPTGTLLEEQLPVTLRTLPFEAGLRMPVRLVRSLVDTKGNAPVVQGAMLSVTEPEPAPVVGRAWKVLIRTPDARLAYWMAADAPHVMARFDGGDGRTLSLEKVSRRTYW